MRSCQVCAAGALLAILHREGLLRNTLLAAPASIGSVVDMMDVGAEADTLLCVDNLAELSLNGQLIVDSMSMRALHIFQVSVLTLFVLGSG
jgi:hypothetical protein